MKRIRAMLADRARGGTIALLTAYMLVLQAFAASYVCAATVAGVVPDVAQVHCLPSGDAGGEPTPVTLADCTCAVFCGMGVGASDLPPEHVLAIVSLEVERDPLSTRIDRSIPALEHSGTHPRAPPRAAA